MHCRGFTPLFGKRTNLILKIFQIKIAKTQCTNSADNLSTYPNERGTRPAVSPWSGHIMSDFAVPPKTQPGRKALPDKRTDADAKCLIPTYWPAVKIAFTHFMFTKFLPPVYQRELAELCVFCAGDPLLACGPPPVRALNFALL